MRIGILAGVLLGGMTAASVHAAEKVVGNAFFRDAPPHRMVLVAKDVRSAYLVEAEDDRPRVVRRFGRILLGANPGDKRVEGDKRTPEGVYYIQRYLPEPRLAPRYGAGAFPLNYPNIVDRIRDKTGYGIWLHGVDEEDEDKTDTKGCVAFDNTSLEVLKEALDIGTPVVITGRPDLLAPSRYEERRAELLERLDRFLEARESGDHAALDALIHPDFRNDRGEDAGAYLRRIERRAAAYPQRRMDIDEVRIYKENGHRLVYDFERFRCAPDGIAFGRQRLYFTAKEGSSPRLLAAEHLERPAGPEILWRVKAFLADREAGDPENLWVRRVRPDRYVVGYDRAPADGAGRRPGMEILRLTGCPGEFRVASVGWEPLP
ncbi:L,D-transpeptidase family protein [Thiohalorhabdus denitrificans]|uniref:L,D-transpeptidase catalytic domain n=1 Tax=Thiohalorhabdus denitrificans TaxID=381306 RepID=A0A1G5GIF5_9GAMM|nr:L,D-transpeptidase family protein [Thiohalorhabdus denitrificans]SCY51151.1 L,D-transpeptidase catalytic domain [Thiohalorhabdus denitrificans]